MTTYHVHISHDDETLELNFKVEVFEAGESEADKTSIAWALRQAANLIEHGQIVSPPNLN